MKRLWPALEVLAGAVFFAVAASVLALRFWVLPDIERYRPLIVERVAAAVGQPVRIGAIDAGWLGLRPQIRLADVRIYDAEGREALVLPSVDNILSWRSLLHGELGLHSLAIDGPRLTVRRDASGSLYVAGMKLTPSLGGARRAGALFGGEIQIRNAEIEWHDEKRGAPPLVLSALNLRLQSDGQDHTVGLTARPPAALGTKLDVRARLEGASPEDWSGRVYVELGYTDLAAWRPWIEAPVALDRGQGALRLWATLERGGVRTLTADLALSGVAARLAPDAAPLELESLTGRLQARRAGDGYQLTARKLAVRPARGAALQPVDFQLAWKPSGGSLSVSALDLEPLAHLAEALPIPTDLRRLLVELEPRGQLADTKVDWRGPASAPERYNLRTRFSELAVKPAGAVPGFAGLAGTVEASEARGRLWLQSRGAVIEVPRLFAEPRIALDALNAQLDWLLEGEALNVRIASASFANADATGTAYGSYSRAGGGPGRIDLSASLTRADGTRVARYVPLVVGEPTRAWLAAGILHGEADDVHLRLRGDLRDFPFTDPAQGEFTVRARVQKGTLHYADGWPRIEDIDAELLFDRDGMQVIGRRGSILGARLENVRVTIAHFGSARVDVNGQAEGETAEFLKYIAASPVRGMTRGVTDAMSAAGRGQLRLSLELPLSDLARSRVAGEYVFAGNRVTVQQKLPPFEQAGGRLSFTQTSFVLDDVRAQAFGGPVTLSGGTQADGMEVVARGEATVPGAAVLFDHPLRRHVSGAAPYVAHLTWRDRTERIVVESSLRGVASALPAPLDKAAAETLPLRVEIITPEGGARDRVLVSLGRLVAYEAHRRREGDAMRVQRAGLVLTPAPGQTVRLPERQGFLVAGSLGALDADRWHAVLGAADSRALGGTSTATTANLKLGRVDIFGRRFNNVALRGASDGSGWSAVLDGDEAAGQISYRTDGGGQVVARLVHLELPEGGAAGKRAGGVSPADLPSMDVAIERFALSGRRLGRMELIARRQDSDWLIERLSITNPDATLSGTGAWRGGAVPRCEVEFAVDATDAGRLLERAGYAGMVAGGKAKLDGMVRWQGELTALDYATLSGELQLHAEEGQFLEIDPGIGKLISLMSLQALPRRIALDFRDVFSKGFRFDSIDATSHVDNGVMQLGEFRMRGATADVAMSGQVDLARETQDLRVRIVPSLGGTAATAVAIVHPVAGIAAALAQKALKDPLGQIFAHDYAVTGSWTDPNITQIVTLAPPNEVATP